MSGERIPGLTRYADPGGCFALRSPSNWTCESRDQRLICVPPGANDVCFAAWCVETPQASDQDLPELVAAIDQELGSLDDVHLLASSEKSELGLQHVDREYMFGVGVHCLQRISWIDGHCLTRLFRAEGDNYQRWLPTGMVIMRSVEVLL